MAKEESWNFPAWSRNCFRTPGSASSWKTNTRSSPIPPVACAEPHPGARRRQGAGRDDALRPEQGSHHLSFQVSRPRQMQTTRPAGLRDGHDRPTEVRSRFRLAPPGDPGRPGRHRARRVRPPISTRRRAGRAAARLRQPPRTRQGRGRARSDARQQRAQRRYILAADTVVAVGRRILPKAELLDEAAQCLRLLSGRNHRVHTAHLPGDAEQGVSPAARGDPGALQAAVRGGHRGLPRLGRVARRAGGCAAQAWPAASSSRSSLLQQRGRPAALRTTALLSGGAIRSISAGSTRCDLTEWRRHIDRYVGGPDTSIPARARYAANPRPRKAAVLLAAVRRCRPQPLAQRRLCRAGERRARRGRDGWRLSPGCP